MKRIHLNVLRRLRKAQDRVMRMQDKQLAISIHTGTDGGFYAFAHNGDRDAHLEHFGELWTPTEEQTEAALARIGNVLGFDV